MDIDAIEFEKIILNNERLLIQIEDEEEMTARLPSIQRKRGKFGKNARSYQHDFVFSGTDDVWERLDPYSIG